MEATTRPQVVVLIGLQASGKSTFARERFSSEYVYLSKDEWPNARNRERRLLDRLREALVAGESAVVDNTNASKDERAPIISLAREYSAELVGYYFASSVAACRERNSEREGKARVPDVAIYTTVKRLERPSLEEGFSHLFYVKIAAERGFSVEDWDEEAGQ